MLLLFARSPTTEEKVKMARSTYIYIIKRGDEIDSAFTVKREMEYHFDNNEYLHEGSVTICRLKDGGTGDSIDITGDYFE